MVFKKNDEFTKQMAKKGGKIGSKIAHELHPEILNNNLKRGGYFDIPENQPNNEMKSQYGKMSRHWENLAVESIKNNYDNIFLPQSACDRICFKDGKIIFIEIKRKRGRGKMLTENQQKFKELCEKDGYSYIIQYI